MIMTPYVPVIAIRIRFCVSQVRCVLPLRSRPAHIDGPLLFAFYIWASSGMFRCRCRPAGSRVEPTEPKKVRAAYERTGAPRVIGHSSITRPVRGLAMS
jgi:hypothetical protein